MEKKSALFICVHNSARSQIAEEYLRRIGGDDWRVESAGFEPGELNPLVVEVLKEDGIDISGKQTKSLFDLYKSGRAFQYVITVCDESEEDKCPIFPGISHRLHLPFPDPSRFEGTREEKLEMIRTLRDQIKGMVGQLVEWDRSGHINGLGDRWTIL